MQYLENGEKGRAERVKDRGKEQIPGPEPQS